MVLSIKNFLNDDEFKIIQDLIDNYEEEQHPILNVVEGYRNDYFKQKITLPEFIINKVNNSIMELLGHKIEIESIWINKIDPNGNLNDHYHRDDTNLSFVYYPNDDFVGGELDVENEILPITKNSVYIILHKVQHRVLKVKSGVRWSIALFCQYSTETKKLI